MINIEYMTENYKFKKAIQQNIIENIQPLLFENKFIRCSKNKYVREFDNLVQFISFSITKDSLKAFAIYIPIFLPWDNLMNYGIEITGSSGIGLLNGKYFTTIYEDNDNDVAIQLQQYKNEHVPNIEKLILTLKEGILPEMDIMNSLRCFVDELESLNATFFNYKYDDYLRNGIPHKYILAVYKCFNEQYMEGIDELNKILELLNNSTNISEYENEIKVYIEKILISMECDLSQRKNNFLLCINQLSDERRKKYKLLK